MSSEDLSELRFAPDERRSTTAVPGRTRHAFTDDGRPVTAHPKVVASASELGRRSVRDRLRRPSGAGEGCCAIDDVADWVGTRGTRRESRSATGDADGGTLRSQLMPHA